MKNYIYLLSILVFLASCEDQIPLPNHPDDLNLITIEAKITTQSNPVVFIGKALTVDVDSALPGISDAVVRLSDNATTPNSILLTEVIGAKGYYTVPVGISFLGVSGLTYSLEINIGEVTIKASDYLAPVESIDSMRIFPSMRGEGVFLGIFTYGQETPGRGNYYKWDIYINDTLLNKVENMAFASDELVDGNYVNGLEIFTDFHDPKIEEDRILKLNDTVVVLQTSLSETAYDFYNLMFIQSSSGGLFSVPPANIPGNFTSSDGKDVLGLFVASDVSVSNTVVIDSTLNSQLKEY